MSNEVKPPSVQQVFSAELDRAGINPNSHFAEVLRDTKLALASGKSTVIPTAELERLRLNDARWAVARQHDIYFLAGKQWTPNPAAVDKWADSLIAEQAKTEGGK